MADIVNIDPSSSTKVLIGGSPVKTNASSSSKVLVNGVPLDTSAKGTKNNAKVYSQ